MKLGKSRMKRTMAALAGVLMACSCALPAAASAAAPELDSTLGPIEGLVQDGTDQFLGVPFAQPPIGALRFAPPAPLTSWTEPLKATATATRCSAPSGGDGVRLVNEDCLYLNVYRPAGTKPDSGLPVMVFIHGGGNTTGSTDIYDGARMAVEGHAVVVTLAYRIGAFGFLATPELSKDGGEMGSGGYALLDLVAGLKWVHDNAAALGGNPNDVMLMGQSAGGTNVCSLMASPAAAGLFQRASIMSGVCGANKPLDKAEEDGVAFAEAVGCTDAATRVECLRALPADTVLDKFSGFLPATPFGTALLPKAPMQSFADGDALDIPTMVGFSRDEMWGFMHGMYPLSTEAYEGLVRDTFGDKAEKVLELYPAASFPHNEYAWGAIQGDTTFVCPAFAIADALSAHQPVSVYEFADMTAPNWKSLGEDMPPPEGYRTGAAHTSELFYLLDYAAISAPLNSEQIALGNEMIRLWAAFGKSGDNGAWPAYSKADRTVLELQLPEAGGIVPSNSPFESHHCDYWNS